MKLLPVREFMNENADFSANPDCGDSLSMCIEFYKKVGFNPPWICYYSRVNEELVGSAAFKGKPVNGKVEIAYGTFPRFQKQGIGGAICKELVRVALKEDPSIIITARTLPEENYSTKILRKSNFEFIGKVDDPEDGEVWEWEFKKPK